MSVVDTKQVAARAPLPDWHIAVDHPLWRVHQLVDERLAAIAPDQSLEPLAGPIPPSRLLKATLLLALFRIRDERQLCDQLHYNLLFRWFLGLSRSDVPPSASTLETGCTALLASELARSVLREVVLAARTEGLLKSYHFNLDHSRLEAWAPTRGGRTDSLWPTVDARTTGTGTYTCASGRFCWLELTATEQTEAIAFYSGVFGWTTREAPGHPHHSIFVLDGRPVASIHVLPPLQRVVGVHPRWLPHVVISGMDELILRAHTLGGEIEGPFEALDGGKNAVLVDPSGAEIGLWEPMPSSTPAINSELGAASWYELHAKDPALARFFYNGIFDWGARTSHDASPYDLWMSNGHAIGGMRELDPEWQGLPAGWMVYFDVDDVTASTLRVTQLGGQVSIAPTELGDGSSFAVVTDPQGAAFGIVKR